MGMSKIFRIYKLMILLKYKIKKNKDYNEIKRKDAILHP